ncbi:hypothetical protein B0H17DRAFT_1124281 [Mycena rosella]|uniref:Uncharacterized protein n=1 Tax=Mycena rosella TaxID=1033263 RepID=A0AAD7MBN2_MYCRO|nr:hypothetical protein B0H17DRAFT_1124281 [Mycena rosella]
MRTRVVRRAPNRFLSRAKDNLRGRDRRCRPNGNEGGHRVVELDGILDRRNGDGNLRELSGHRVNRNGRRNERRDFSPRLTGDRATQFRVATERRDGNGRRLRRRKKNARAGSGEKDEDAEVEGDDAEYDRVYGDRGEGSGNPTTRQGRRR